MATCKDCHDCAFDLMCTYIGDWVGIRTPCPAFKDKSRFVELPCKVGDSVFTIDKKGNIQECIVINVNCKTQMMLDEKPWIDFIIVTEPVDDSLPFPMIFTYSITKNRILFLTRGSAEQALKEREK